MCFQGAVVMWKGAKIMTGMDIFFKQFSKIRKTATFAIIIAVAVLALAWFGIYKIRDKYDETKKIGLDICDEWKERNATLTVGMFNGYGVLDVSSNDEAYMELIDGGVVSAVVFTKTGYCIELSDGLPLTRSKSPVDQMRAAIEQADSVKKIDASKVTGFAEDSGKEAVVYKIEGVGNVSEFFRNQSSLADATLTSYGVTPQSEVSLLVSGYRGICMEDETDGHTEIVNENLVGFGCLQMDLIVDGKAYMIYSIGTRATYDTPISLGSEIYKRGVNDIFTSEQSLEIAKATIESVKAVLKER